MRHSGLKAMVEHGSSETASQQRRTRIVLLAVIGLTWPFSAHWYRRLIGLMWTPPSPPPPPSVSPQRWSPHPTGCIFGCGYT